MSQHSVRFNEDKRYAVYDRDGYKCAYCGVSGDSKTGGGLSLDHIDARASGGAGQGTKHSEATNLITACLACNSAKQDKTPREWNAYVKARGMKVDWKLVRRQAGKPIDVKKGAELAKQAKDARKSAAGKPAGPGVKHDPSNGQFTSGMAALEPRPRQAKFREGSLAALAMDPGGAGVIAGVHRGVQPQPAAFGMFDCPPPVEFVPEEVEDGVAVLAVSGPLEHHASWLWTSYESLVAQVARALAHADVRAVVLKIDSPGGVAAGMGEAHKALRKLAKTTGKPIYAFADEMACSAAYHLASACSEVWTSEAGVLGSVGVILCTIDESAAFAKQGVAIRYVVTGARKADLHPGQAVTDDVLDVAQAKVDYLGGLFFAAVGKARAMSPAAVEALQAAVFHGPGAVKAGLSDGVASWDKFFSYVKDSVRATIFNVGATAQKSASATTPKAAKMKLIQAKAALAAARKAYKAAAAAFEANPTDSKARKAFEASVAAKASAKIAVEAAQPDAKMHTVTKTSKHVTKEESDSEEESVPSTEKSSAESSEESSGSSSADSSATSTDVHSEEEEEESADAKMAGKGKAKGKTKGKAEEEEEESTAKAWAAAHKAYKASSEGIDAYAIHGPKKFLAAVLKATGQTTVAGALGALAALPKRAKADAKIAADVDKLKAAAAGEKVNAIVDAAKIEGKAPSKAMRASLREMGAKMGPAYLKGHVATLPAVIRTTKVGAFVPREGTDGAALGVGGDDEAKMLAQLTAGMAPDKAKAFEADYRKRLAASTPTAPKH